MLFFKGKKQATEQKKPPHRRQKGEGASPVLSDLATLVLLAVDLYLLASLLTPWTGDLGYALSGLLLLKLGGSILIPLFFFGYLLFGRLFRREMDRPFFEFLGTVTLFTGASLALGLRGLTGTPTYRWLGPGEWGSGLAFFLYRNIGPLGTILVGLLTALLSLILFRPSVLLAIRHFPQKVSPLVDLLGRIGIVMKKRFSTKDLAVPESDVSAFGSQAEEMLPEFPRCDLAGPSEELDLPEESGPSEDEEDTENVPVAVVRRKSHAEEGDTYPPFVEKALTPPLPTTTSSMLLPCPPSAKPCRNIPDGEDHLQELFKKEASPDEITSIRGDGEFPPPLDFFGPQEPFSDPIDQDLIRRQGERIIQTLAEFGIEAEMAEKVIGPTVVQFRIQLAPGIKVSRVASLNNDLAVALAVPSLRVEAPIPGKPYVGIEIPNPRRVSVSLRSIVESPIFEEGESDLPLPLGQGVDGSPLVIGLEDLPHMLVAGTTGSGKSVFVNSCILGLCSKRRPEELRLLLVDPKRVEMSFYEKLPHTLTPPIVDAKKAVHALAWALREMERRYEIFARSRVRNLAGYNAKALPKDRFPHIVIVVDELADLMMTSPKEVEDYICRLAQMARATGIHLVVATQRPSVNVITGLIKANIPARVAFTLPSQADSRTILDVGGAEKLLGKGDMLFLSPRYPKPLRIQSPWIDEGRISALIAYLVELFGEPQHIEIDDQSNGSSSVDDPQLEDPMIRQAVNAVLESGIASASRLQRQLRVGFTRAARLVDAMETLGIVGPQEGSKPREILVDEDRAEEILSRLEEH